MRNFLFSLTNKILCGKINVQNMEEELNCDAAK